MSSQVNPIKFEKVGGSLQPVIKTAADMKNLLDLSPLTTPSAE